MFLLYLDEFGHAGAWEPSDPNHRHHPLFGLAGIVVEGRRWKDLDRGFLRLKSSFFRNEIEQLRIRKGLRAERFEPKNLKGRRDLRFADQVLDLIGSTEGRILACGHHKRTGLLAHDERALYTSTAQGALRQFEKILK